MKFSILGSGNFNTDVILDLPAIVIPKSRIDIDPTDRAMIEESLEKYTEVEESLKQLDTAEDILFSVVDSNDVQSWLTARNSDGMAPDWVIDNIRSRLGSLQSKVPTVMTKMSLWGASDARDLNTALQAMATGLGVTDYFSAHNAGATMDSLWDNQGSRPLSVRFTNNRILATSTAQPVTMVDGIYRPSFRSRVSYVGNTGVEGTFVGNTFTRASVVAGASQDINLTGDVKLISKSGIQYANGVQIWIVGRNDIAYYSMSQSVVSDIVNAYAEAFDKIPTWDKKVLILGFWPQTTNNVAVNSKVWEVNGILRQTYGERFIDIAPYLMSAQVFTDTGIARTQADITAAGNGLLPPSLASDTVHLVPSVNQAIVTNLIRPRLIAMGWYS